MAAKSIPGFKKFEDVWDDRAPLGWDVTDSTAVAKACVALLQRLVPATTGEIVHVDGGFHATGRLTDTVNRLAARDLAVPAPAPRQPGRLVPVGSRGVRRGDGAQRADPAVASATRPATGAT